MSPDPSARNSRAGLLRPGPPAIRALLVAGAFLSGAGPAEAAFVPVFRWNAKLSGGYTGNVFYSQGKDKVSSYGGTLRLFASLVWKGPKSNYGGNYRTSYASYNDKAAQDLATLSHTLSLTINQEWSQRTRFTASAKGTYSPEQDPFAELTDPTEFTFTVRPRSQKTSVGLNGGWDIAMSGANDLQLKVNWGTTIYGDPILPPTREGAPPPQPPQPFVDEQNFKIAGAYQWEVAEKRRVDLSGSWGRRLFSNTAIEYEALGVDLNNDGTVRGAEIEDYKKVGETTTSGSADSLTLTSGYSWELSELTRGAVGVGILASNDESGQVFYNWALSMAINQELSPRARGTFGASRDQSSFEGTGTAAIGTRAYANFEFDTSPKTGLKTTTSFSRSDSLDEASTRVEYLKVTIVFSHLLGKWGGYNISYAYNDQQSMGDLVSISNGRTRYDIIAFGLNFDPAKLVDSPGGKQK